MLDKNKLKFKKADLSVTVILLISIVAVFNFFSYLIFFRWDLTENDNYSISKVSKRVVSELDDIVLIKAYFSENLPNQLLSLRQEVSDILEEYAAYSGGKVHLEFIDPKEDEGTQQKLQALGIPQLTFESYEKDQVQLMHGYLGIVISFEDRNEVIPAIKKDTGDLEYQLTSAIKKVLVDEIATIGILSSHKTLTVESGLQYVNEELGNLYDVRSVRLEAVNPEIPAEVDTLVIAGDKEVFNEDQLKAINSFLARGGALLVMHDGIIIGEGLSAQQNQTGLPVFLEKYGIKINNDLIADTRSGLASFTQGFLTFSVNYPFWPKVNSDGLNQEHSAVSGLENVVFPWVSSVEVDKEKININDFKYLAHTTAQSWRLTDNFNIMPTNNAVPSGEKEEYNLAVAINGNIKNAYPESGASDIFPARIVVVGDSDFASDGFLRQSPENLALFQNLVDSLSFDEDLMSIRAKNITNRPIKDDLTDSDRAFWRYLNVFGLTAVIIAYGMFRYYMRKKSNFIDEI